LHDVFVARERARTTAPRRAHGYVDGYMRALLERRAGDEEELSSSWRPSELA